MNYFKKGVGIFLVAVLCLCNFSYVPLIGYAQNIDSKTIKSKEASHENTRAYHIEEGDVINCKFKVMKKSPEILSMLLIETNVDEGCNEFKTPYNLNPETGEEILLGDIFEDVPEHREVIKEYLKNKKREEIEEYNIEDDKFYLYADNLVILVKKKFTTEEFVIPLEYFKKENLYKNINLK